MVMAKQSNNIVENDVIDDFQFDPEDVILLMLEANERLFGKNTFKGITRLEKLIFLLKNETDFDSMDEFFKFKAYDFGPFSKEVYEGIDFLENYGLIEVKERPYPSYYANNEESELNEVISDSSDEFSQTSTLVTEKLFALTELGYKAVKKIREIKLRRDPDDIKKLENMIQRYGDLPLNQIIRYVYKRYPKMAENSIHPEANNI
jgi:uncharacterized protein YwgA